MNSFVKLDCYVLFQKKNSPNVMKQPSLQNL